MTLPPTRPHGQSQICKKDANSLKKKTECMILKFIKTFTKIVKFRATELGVQALGREQSKMN